MSPPRSAPPAWPAAGGAQGSSRRCVDMHRAIGFGSRSRLQAVVLRGFAKKGKSDAALANAVSGQLETALDFAELSER